MRMFRLVKRAMKEVTGVDILGTEKKCREAMADTEFEFECGEYITDGDEKKVRNCIPKRVPAKF